MRAGVLLLMVFLMSTAVAVAQTDRQDRTEDADLPKHYIYQWSDESGVVHITDGLDKVPKQYRRKALKQEAPPAEEAERVETRQVEPPLPVRRADKGSEELEKVQWQQRLREARQRLKEVQERYAALDRKHKELLTSWGGPASGRLAERSEAEKIAEQMKGVQKEIDDARNEIEIVIPDEARKAGVPPGWLRE